MMTTCRSLKASIVPDATQEAKVAVVLFQVTSSTFTEPLRSDKASPLFARHLRLYTLIVLGVLSPSQPKYPSITANYFIISAKGRHPRCSSTLKTTSSLQNYE